jgi:hypothetical protein
MKDETTRAPVWSVFTAADRLMHNANRVFVCGEKGGFEKSKWCYMMTFIFFLFNMVMVISISN